ncbi:hypothetical protein [Mycobacterium syngnathidarum]|uniref:hypothetical protein n=1 Tax=Mycobacterium syngnathidarum TaxID=1908205 RepID=UPI00095C711F|nr:hypothetical protein [Mycobacterium syngnathidarum]OLT97882.1 hypothetical protein BKG60_03855 [Mycobacterium syngnathidarum]
MTYIEYPPSEYAGLILGDHWPKQSEYEWQAFAGELRADFGRLILQEESQQSIQQNLENQTSVGLIPALKKLVAHRNMTLADRLSALQTATPAAEAVSAAIISLKSDLYWIVMTADQQIKDAEARHAGLGKAAALAGEIATIIGNAQADAATADTDRAAEVAAQTTKVLSWKPNESISEGGSGAATPLSTGTGSSGIPAPLSPNNGVEAVDYNTFKDSPPSADAAPQREAVNSNQQQTLTKQEQQAAWNPDKVKDAATTPSPDKSPVSPSHSSPPSSAPSSGGSPASSGGSPSSVIGQMMRPPMSSSPASSSPASSSGSGVSSSGGPASATSAAAHTGTPGSPAGAGAPGGSGAAPGVRAAGLASAGSGIAESAARMGTGAVNATANALGTAGNVGSQVAQGAAASASHAATPAAAAAPPPASSAPVSGAPVGGAPMAMVPPASPPAGGVVSPVGGGPNVGPGVPGTPSQGAPGLGGPIGLAGASSSNSGAGGPVPVAMPMQQMRTFSATPDATGEVLIGQAADAARSIVESMIAQTRKMGYAGSGFSWAVSMLYERTGAVTAWLASSEGPSYIPLGVRVPDDVRLAVTDAVVGRQLWEESAAAGGADPLKLLAQHAELHDAATPGSRVLVLASSLPKDRVSDWAANLGARPVSVDSRTIDAASANGAGQHRCAVAMPWEWQQANRFTEQQRWQVAAQHATLAATAGHLTEPRCTRVIDLFERQKPISDSDWADVREACAKTYVDYFMAQSRISAVGGGDPTPLEWAFRTARAAEVVACLRDHATTEGCADLLYATRLAGAPLNPAAAVT